MNYSLSVIGNRPSEFTSPDRYGNQGIEVALFSRAQLEPEPWNETWANVNQLTSMYGHRNVTFHFPVDDSDYVEDSFVRSRLSEGYYRASEVGLRGLVVHSNRVRPVEAWRQLRADSERFRVLDILSDVRNRDASSSTWLGIENMPLVGNHGMETDPLFTSTEDFIDLPNELTIVWDVCHAKSSEQYLRALQLGQLPPELFARSEDGLLFNPTALQRHKIVHWHFASNRGLNNPLTGSQCTEGVLPQEGDLPESDYEDALRDIAYLTGDRCTINFEVQEDDYHQRHRGPAIIQWASRVLST